MGDRDADAILAALRVSPGGMTRTEINVGVFNRNRTSEAITRGAGAVTALQTGPLRTCRRGASRAVVCCQSKRY